MKDENRLFIGNVLIIKIQYCVFKTYESAAIEWCVYSEDMATAPEVREGFLCPMCMKDLGTVTQLQGHFEEEHSAEDKDVLRQLRGTHCRVDYRR